MTRFRGTSRVRQFGTRNLARVVVAGVVVAGSPLALAGTATAATPGTAPAPSASDGVWDQIAKCESGGKWNTSTGNGYSGGLQFAPSTWRAYGGKGSAHGASKAEQIQVAEKVLAAQGWGAWPSCSKKVGAKGKSSSSSQKLTTVSKKHSSATKSSRNAIKHTKKRVHSKSSDNDSKSSDNDSKSSDD